MGRSKLHAALRFRYRCLLVAALLLPYSPGCTKGSSTSKNSGLAEQLARLKATLAEAALVAGKATPSQCDQTVIDQAVGQSGAKVLLVTEGQLNSLKDTPTPPHATLWNKKLAQISWQPNNESEAILNLSKFQDLKKRYPVLGVVSVAERRAPRALPDGFQPGRFRAQLTLFQLGESASWCTAAAQATSSTEVAQRTGEDRQQALVNDLDLRIRRSLEDTIRGMSRSLSL